MIRGPVVLGGLVLLALASRGITAAIRPAVGSDSGPGSIDPADPANGAGLAVARTVAHEAAPPDAGTDACELPIRWEEAGYDRCSLRVDVVDGDTGGALAARWHHEPSPASYRYRFDFESLPDQLQHWEDSFLHSGRTAEEVYRVNTRSVSVRTPEGWRVRLPDLWFTSSLAADVSSAFAIVAAHPFEPAIERDPGAEAAEISPHAGPNPLYDLAVRVPDGPSFERDDPGDAPLASVRVVVRGCDGRPCAGARVDHATARLRHGEVRTDAVGEALLLDVPAGTRTVYALCGGRLPSVGVVGVRAGECAEVVLHEPVGARLDVGVVDEEGRPRPFARVFLDRHWFDVRSEGQRLDSFTDVDGLRSIARVEPGRAKVTAEWRGRFGEETVELRDEGRASVRIVVK